MREDKGIDNSDMGSDGAVDHVALSDHVDDFMRADPECCVFNKHLKRFIAKAFSSWHGRVRVIFDKSEIRPGPQLKTDSEWCFMSACGVPQRADWLEWLGR
jgi:hypothetical protein